MYRNFLLSIIIVVLSGCSLVVKPNIEKKHDEITKSKVCRLENFILNQDFSNTATLNLVKEANNFKSILTITTINSSNNFKTTDFSTTFSIYNKEQVIIEQIKIKAHTVAVKDWKETQYESIYDDNSNSITNYYTNVSCLIPFTREHLKKIGSADFVRFIIEGNNQSIKGKLNKTDVNFFKQFEEECFSLK